MDKHIIIIDLHCDPTMPAGANEAGGGNVYMRQLLHELSNSQFQVTYFTRKKYPDLEDYLKYNSRIDFYRLDLGNWGANDKNQLQHYCKEALRQIELILSFFSDQELVFHSSYWQSGKIALSLAQEYHTFFVHTVLSNSLGKAKRNGSRDDPPERLDWERDVFSSAKYILCSSESEAKDIQELYGIDKNHIIVTGLKVDAQYFQRDYNRYASIQLDTVMNRDGGIILEKEIPNDIQALNMSWWTQKSFLYIGRLHIDKGLDKIIEAWAILYSTLGNSVPPLWIVGGSISGICSFREKMLDKFPQLQLWENSHLLVWWGPLRPSSIRTLMLKAYAIITHSRYESAGLVILEALTNGIPVLVTPYGYGKDLIINWYNGFQVPYGDTLQLYKRMLAFVSQPYLSQLLGINAEKTAKQAEEEFDFFNKHLYAYGLKDELVCQKRIVQPYNNRGLLDDIIDFYPFLVDTPSIERINSVFKINLGERPSNHIQAQILCPKHLMVQTELGNTYVVIILKAHISKDHTWNRFFPNDPVQTIGNQITSVEQFGYASEKYTVIWKSCSEGLIIISCPQLSSTWRDNFGTFAPANLKRTESLRERWNSLTRLIETTPCMQRFQHKKDQIECYIKRGIDLEESLPSVIYYPYSKKENDILSLQFEQSCIGSVANYIAYTDDPNMQSSCIAGIEDDKIQVAVKCWKYLRDLEQNCKSFFD